MKTAIPQFLIALLILCLGLSSNTQAVSPPPDGGYPGGNTAEGDSALAGLTSGLYNSAFGFLSLQSNTTGNFNTAVGAGALLNNTAEQNTATGAGSLLNNTTGNFNTAIGEAALFFNTTGNQNTATGASALQSNTTGTQNTANGVNALTSNTTGPNNTSVGRGALASNTTGANNTSVGRDALASNTTGNFNTANGELALSGNTTGINNTALGRTALINNVTGSGNTAVGLDALSNSTGSFNTVVGRSAGSSVTTANRVICIGANVGGANLNNSCYIGSIFGQTSSAGTAVFINSDGKLGTATSSKRFKEDIKAMDKASEALFSLKPVSFHYKKEIDPASTSQLGLVAEEVEKVNPDLVVRDKEGKPYSVRYDQVNAMLLNEFLKEHRKVEQLEKQVEVLTAGLQRVSTQLETSKTAPQTVLNN
jgi:hypothetical protein